MSQQYYDNSTLFLMKNTFYCPQQPRSKTRQKLRISKNKLPPDFFAHKIQDKMSYFLQGRSTPAFGSDQQQVTQSKHISFPRKINLRQQNKLRVSTLPIENTIKRLYLSREDRKRSQKQSYQIPISYRCKQKSIQKNVKNIASQRQQIKFKNKIKTNHIQTETGIQEHENKIRKNIMKFFHDENYTSKIFCSKNNKLPPLI